MNPARLAMQVYVAGRRWSVAAHGHDLSIALQFDAPQPGFFGAARASAQPLAAGSFTGDVRTGASCNCESYTITPHCNGTHTECVGHITQERIAVRDCALDHYTPALLLTTAAERAGTTSEASDPGPQAGDLLVTRARLQAAAGAWRLDDFRALVVRTLPNSEQKRHRNYDEGAPAAYFTREAMEWIVASGIEHLVVDLPSIDRANDQGRLTCHRIFWGLPAGGRSVAQATRARATITELAYIHDRVADGIYLLNLQVAPFEADAAPSRPILLPLSPV